MKLQTKILLIVIPFLLLSLLLLGLWSFAKAKEGVFESHMLYLDIVLDSYTSETLDKNYRLLEEANLENVKSYIKNYQQVAFDKASAISKVRDGHLFILNESGKLVFSSLGHDAHSLDIEWQQKVHQLILNDKSARVTGRFDKNDYHEVYSARYFKPWGWAVFYSIADENMDALVNGIFMATFIIAVLYALGASILIFIFFKLFLIRPIETLKNTAAQIADQQDISVIDVDSRDELGALARSMEVMSQSIQRHKREHEQSERTLLDKQEELQDSQRKLELYGDSLEQLVEERTSKLNEANEQLQNKIVERQRAEEQMLESKEHIVTILNSIGDAVIATDIEGKITLINPVAETLTGWKKEEAVGKPYVEVLRIMNGLSNEAIFNPTDKALVTEKINSLSNDVILISKQGSSFKITVCAALMMNANELASGLVMTFQDISEKSKIEEELFKTRKLESVGLLAGGIAHDFNNLLMGLFGNIALAERKVPKEHQAYDYIQTSLKSLDVAKNLTQQLLTFAQGAEPILDVIDVKKIVIDSTKFSLSGSNIKADYSFPDNQWLVKADKGQLSQVITNLTINAKQAMPDGGGIYIDVQNIQDAKKSSVCPLSGDLVKITVRDEGCGISQESIAKIFDPYYSTKKEGSGLGLATSHRIIGKHNGSISVESILGEGTTFTIYLPAEMSVCPVAGEVSSSINSESETINGRVLVMDDDEDIRDVISGVLEALGYTAESVVDGNQVIEKYADARKSGVPFDIVIMDLTIPGGMGGREAIQELLAIDPAIKAIVSSGYSTDPILANYLDYGFKGRLVKPFKINECENELKRVLS